MTTQDERRSNNGRRATEDRRQNSFSMISNYANYSGAERRFDRNRRLATERRTVAC